MSNDRRPSREQAARFVARIANHCFFVENRLACGAGTYEDLKFWRAQFKYAERAFWKVYPSAAAR